MAAPCAALVVLTMCASTILPTASNIMWAILLRPSSMMLPVESPTMISPQIFSTQVHSGHYNTFCMKLCQP